MDEMTVLPPDEMFLVDEFFTDESENWQTVEVKVAGKMVPFKLKKTLGLADRLAAESKAVVVAMNPVTKKPEAKIDPSHMTFELAFRAVIEWPFKNKDGSPYPLTRENLLKLKASGADILKFVQMDVDEDAVAQALGPFVQDSVSL